MKNLLLLCALALSFTKANSQNFYFNTSNQNEIYDTNLECKRLLIAPVFLIYSTSDSVITNSNSKPERDWKKGFKRGFKVILEGGYLVRMKESSGGLERIKGNLVLGYQADPNFSIGLGMGVRQYRRSGSTLIPITIDIRGNILKNKFSPFIGLAFGMSFQAIEGLQEVGEIIEPSIGLSMLLSNKTALNFSVGYEIQQLGKANFFIPGGSVSKAVSINLGVSF